ncbi:hypothetical protein ACPA54_36625 [Uniformispora flossi]|uniref:hypothetical protein n=1 Tax=Uniformispora flossi TaxID=3390723 RepID=UPI003C2B9F7F
MAGGRFDVVPANPPYVPGPDTALPTHGPALVTREPEPFGPVMSARAAHPEERGLIAPGCREEELVVIRADRG